MSMVHVPCVYCVWRVLHNVLCVLCVAQCATCGAYATTMDYVVCVVQGEQSVYVVFYAQFVLYIG